MEQQQLTIGLFGFGVVGEGLYKVLQQTPSLNASIRKICIRQAAKQRSAPATLFTLERDALLFDPAINVIVEVIDDPVAAFSIVKTALLNGKDVVSASKKMIADHLPELLQLQKETGRSLLYEAAACASIPVIRNLEEYYDNDLLHSISGIINGSTNFILTRMAEEGLRFRDALLLAQQAGFAESDPRLDIEGHDAANKWTLLLAHAYGIVASPSSLLYRGIQDLHPLDTQIARANNQRIKLVANAQKLRDGRVVAYVLPQFVDAENPLAFIRDEYNGVVIGSGFADNQFFYGKGAGSFPTASAVLSDISALRYRYKYEYKKCVHPARHVLGTDVFLKVYVSFDELAHVRRDAFEWIEEWHSREDRKYLVGVIRLAELLQHDWWKTNGVSLLLLPAAVIEDTEIRKLRKRSLELAGVV